MGKGKRSRPQLQQQSESVAASGPGRRRYHWDPKVRWFRLAEIDGERVKNGPLLDMDELGRQTQAELGRQGEQRPPRRAP
jgi:hypothetical protein